VQSGARIHPGNYTDIDNREDEEDNHGNEKQTGYVNGSKTVQGPCKVTSYGKGQGKCEGKWKGKGNIKVKGTVK